ncbi:MAG: hypothetical protein HYV63_30390 [Candidatus Schekmanbacteria bacterium]|nr:hypothetical protein [Candidatus Schekmanbacteria bacterium]
MVAPDHEQCWLRADPAIVAAQLVPGHTRIVFAGDIGTGKTTLLTGVADALVAERVPVEAICADPGQPAFGVPGCVSIARRCGRCWHVLGMVGLGSLDALRFRLPLVAAVRRLPRAPECVLLVDTPGAVRGMAAAELLAALVATVEATAAVVVERKDEAQSVLDDLAVAGATVVRVRAAAAARGRSSRQRRADRTSRWEEHIAGAQVHELPVAGLAVGGAPPPVSAAAAWSGRQAVLVGENRETLAMGELLGVDSGVVRVLAPRFEVAAARALIVRDAIRRDGVLTTARPHCEGGRLAASAPAAAARLADWGAGSRRSAGRAFVAELLGGPFDDPILHLRCARKRRSILFDIGATDRLPARVAHQITDAFVTHAHIDHIAGLLWLIRCRIGYPCCCRLFGPPGFASHVANLVASVRWDRIGDAGPRFEITEVGEELLSCWELVVGKQELALRTDGVRHEGTLLEEPGFRVRAITLDHGIPVLAFAAEEKPDLARRPPGRTTTDDDRAGTGRVVYATDLADSPSNRSRLIAFARAARTLYCEAAFRVADAALAHATGHLTTRACGEIASAANVRCLVPFHFSRRYERIPAEIYAEVLSQFPDTAVPQGLESARGACSPARSGAARPHD